MARALLIHPWIHDFAAHDFWLKPLGLLRLAACLRRKGIAVRLIDCLDPHHPSIDHRRVRRGPFGEGKFFKEEIPKPSVLSWVPRRYGRYGITPAAFEIDLRSTLKPDVILISAGMTYWYPGVQETIYHCREIYPDVPVVMGGIYPTLCGDHARQHSGADLVVQGGDWTDIIQALSAYLPWSSPAVCREIVPAWDLASRSRAVVVKSSEGCPYRCSYCASSVLAPVHRRREPEAVADEIAYALLSTRAGDVAFYDDALLWEAGSHLELVIEKVKRRGLGPRFHGPNGLHARFITSELAERMWRWGFQTIRLGLESAHPSFHERTGAKVHPDEFRQAVHALRSAGYGSEQIGAYVLAGLPGQTVREVEASIQYVVSAGATPYLAEFSPIPGTGLWREAVELSPYPLTEEPLFHNNTLLPCSWSGFSYQDLIKLKSSLKVSRTKLKGL